jgi:predicted transcriptional regulator
MIRGANKLLRAETEESILSSDDIKPVKYNADFVLDALQSHKKHGLSNWEIAQITGLKSRRVREEVQRLRQKGMIKEETCRCKRTPIYYIL